MAFLEFECTQKSEKQFLCFTGKGFSLAGYNLIYQAWERKEKPLNEGWHVSQDELLKIHSKGQHDTSTRRLVIDYDPKSTRHIGLVELLDIYAFTWGQNNGEPAWTPLMLRLRELVEKEYEEPFESSRKDAILANLTEPEPTTPDFVEFLYLNGADKGWNWGMNGMTNAAFLHGAARDYFRKFF